MTTYLKTNKQKTKDWQFPKSLFVWVRTHGIYITETEKVKLFRQEHSSRKYQQQSSHISWILWESPQSVRGTKILVLFFKTIRTVNASDCPLHHKENPRSKDGAAGHRHEAGWSGSYGIFCFIAQVVLPPTILLAL